MIIEQPLSPIIARRLTAPVAAAIATIAVEGPQAVDCVNACLIGMSGKPVVLDKPSARFALWRFAGAELPDEHVVVLVRNMQSIEIHCHGGVAVTDRILAQLRVAGCLPAAPRELETVSGSCMTDESIQEAARQLLQRAATLKVASVWLDQYQGALAREFALLRQWIANGDKDRAAELCDQLLIRARFGAKLIKPWRLTLAGPPNVGKSSLVNALCGLRRVLVHHEAGTTRDAIESELVIAGWPVVLTDTAGIRDSTEPIEQQGVSIAWQRWQSTDIGLLIVDASLGWTLQHERLLSGPKLVIIVINKTDLVSVDEAMRIKDCISYMGKDCAQSVVCVSALSSDGIAELIEAVGNSITSSQPPPGSGVPFACEHVEWLEHLRNQLK